LKTYYRWISECSMPVNRIRQFETLCGASFVSDYLALAGGKMVIDMPTGKRADERDLAELQALTARAIALLIDFYAGHAALGETSEALNGVLTGWSFHRANVVKLAEPELDFNQGE
ncbi:hypothetical protein ABWL39_20510, partial [Chitinivorax sp. PXF-14]|uniref:hypothetical protein n=1 Tax=Chitinivorax sp. PXF-14 TaxID=3230488 RepID=UPI0034666428